MKIIRAEHLGMCFGVRDAIALAQETAASEPVTVLGQLVHNQTVIDRMRRHGVAFAESPADVRTEKALITAHGASDRAIGRAEAEGLTLVDTTCPLVGFAHRAVRTLVRDGYHPVVIGKRGHVEVRGLTEDLAEVDIVLTEEEVERLGEHERFGVCAQTTQPITRVKGLVSAMQRRFPRSEVRFVDTVCQPTKQRQQAAVDLAAKCDVVIVVGGANSNNTRELVETCRAQCRRVHHVQFASDLNPDWFAEAEVAGLTAGTSTPDDVIQAVELEMSRIAAGRKRRYEIC